MDELKKAIFAREVSKEPFAKLMKIRLIEMNDGQALCEMEYKDEMDNIHGMAHGGAIFSLIDEAFEISANSHGNIAVALSMNITYIKPASKNSMLRARSTEISKGRKTATYHITVEDREGLVAVCQALAYRKKDRLQFLKE